MKLNYIIFFVLITFALNAQPIINQSYQVSYQEKALGFIGFNTFNICLSQPQEASRVRIHAINADGTTRFYRFLGSNQLADSWMTELISKKATRDKGMIFVLEGKKCGATSILGSARCYGRIDSLGNTIFLLPSYYYDNNVTFDTISNNFYYITEGCRICRINSLTGAPTNTIFSFPFTNTISASCATSKKQVILSTSNSIMVIDTLGTIINSTPLSFRIKKIFSVKSNFLFLNMAKNIIEKRDSLLQIIASYSCDPGYRINDLDVVNDTAYFALYNPSSKLSKVISLNAGLTVIQTKNINNTYQEITSINKVDQLKILLNDYTLPIGYFIYLTNGDFATTGFAVFNSINDIQFDHDLAITNITNISCTTSTGCCNQTFTYTNKITVKNNSADTVKKFNLNHYISDYIQGSNLGCTPGQQYSVYQKKYSLTIDPQASIDITLPEFIAKPHLSYSNIQDLNFSYNVNSPNGKIENNTANNTYSQTIHFDFSPPIVPPTFELSGIEIFPNPTEKFIKFNSTNGLEKYTIHDVLGKKVMENNDFTVIDISTLSPAFYFITIQKGNEKTIKKFLKQ